MSSWRRSGGDRLMTEWRVRRSGDQASSWKTTMTLALGSGPPYARPRHAAFLASSRLRSGEILSLQAQPLAFQL